ncbi:MAG: tyrosine--tRNA ligase [Alphaproteobacteria bacterium]
MSLKSDFINEIESRGFIYQSSDLEILDKVVSSNKITGYIGFDITSDSLHIGSLVQLMLLHWLDFYGHNALALVGGATTLIGDPSGKDSTRKILKKEDVDKNIKNISNTFKKFINLKKNSQIVNNYEWLSEINYIEFLRDIGSKITLNKMLTFESIKNRLEREQSLSILEFNYMLLQAYDFFHLNKKYNCQLQMGGSDQWGNILSGIDLIKKISKKKAFGITSPLITNTDGTKMGKTAEGAIWLDEKKLSNYDFFQFWRNVDDDSVPKFLNLFTKLPISEIKKLSLLKNEEINESKEILAFEVTKIVRGEEGAKEAKEISDNLFKSKTIDNRIRNYSINLKNIKENTFTIIDAIEKLELVSSRSEIKRLVKSSGIKINDKNYNENNYSLLNFINNDKIKISVGKKKIGIIKFTNQ